MRSVLIFGIGGFVGRYLSQEFIDNGYHVFGSDLKKAENSQENIDFYEADLMDVDAVSNLVCKVGPDIIINLAAISSVGLSWSIPQTTMSVNVIGALNVMEAARNIVKMPKVMFIGSSEEYQESDKPINEEHPLNANSPYGISKMALEKFVEGYRERYGMKIYYVRPFNHTGVGQKDTFVLSSFCKQVAEIEKSGKPGKIMVGNLDIARDFSDVRDIVRGYRMIVENDDCSKVFNIGSGNTYTLHDLLKFIVSLSSQNIEIYVDPARLRSVDNPIICCDYSYINRELGWKPKYSIFDTLREMYQYYITA